MDPSLKFGRLAVSKNILMSEGVKTEQTAMMVQNMLQSQPLLYRRFIESKLSRFNK